ncbi:hypothetical protein [Parasphingorhabdus sp.]|uniref:hypothetical protein n=1 Tax=Parasphingorhabdus sp. TaxID=2709688 RepID=UPI003002285D
MKRKLAIVICLIFLASGIIRIGVSALMIGQAMGWWIFDGEAVEALADTQRFIAEADINLVGFTPLTYFAFIMVMGLTISGGAVGQLWRRRWGLTLIALYLLSHAALFINFMTVNPKIFLWGLSVVMAGVLVWASRTAEADERVTA